MLKNYIKIAFRVMLRQKFFTAVSIFGISFTIMFFSIAAGITSLYFGNAAPAVNRYRTIYYKGFGLESDQSAYKLSGADFYKNVRRLPDLETLSMYSLGNIDLFHEDEGKSLQTAFTDEQIWKIYDFEFIEGRPYTEKEAQEGQSLAIITESVKEYYFGDQPGVGKTIDSYPRLKIVGVIKDFASAGTDIESSSIFVPLKRYGAFLKDQQESYSAVILAKDRADIPAIKEGLVSLIQNRYQAKKSDVVLNATDIYDGFKGYLAVAGTFLFFIIIIPTLNLIGLNVNRIAERRSEIGVRKAFGASSGILTTQFIIENVIITLLGGFVGILLTFAGSDLISNFFHPAGEFGPTGSSLVNWEVISAALIASLIFGLLSGVVPARRMSKFHVVQALKTQS
jgi:putative ABC transport system permease protein